MYLIEKDGEKQWVKSLQGYDKSWTVHGKDTKFEPVEHAEFVNGKWKIDSELRAKADRRVRAMSMDQHELFEYF